MKKGRLLLLGVALLAGGGAFFMVAMGGGDEAAPVAQIIPQVSDTKTVRVLVADRTFQRGEQIDPAATAWAKWPEDAIPDHVITEDNEAFYDSLPSLRARTAIYDGEPIIAAKTVAQGDRGVVAALLTPGMRAVSANVSGDRTASGFVLPGDRVDIMTTANVDGQPRTTVLLSNVRVLAIDNTLQDEGNPLAIKGSQVTFELTPSQVGTLVAAKEGGNLTLVLRSLFDGEVVEEEEATDQVIVLRYGQG
jgi:pilus assembly protein CpaB